MSQMKSFAPYLFCFLWLTTAGCNTAPETADEEPASDVVTEEAPQDTSTYRYTTYPFQIGDNFVALSPLPGKENLEEDVKSLKEQNITAVVSLVSEEELKERGLTNFFEVFAANGIEVYHSPITDFGLPRETQMDSIIQYMQSQLDADQNVLVHCMGGYGRSGTVMGSYANSVLGVENPIEFVRLTRGEHAIETEEQEEFVRNYGNASEK
jgi:protein-tyrosine phosphatase